MARLFGRFGIQGRICIECLCFYLRRMHGLIMFGFVKNRLEKPERLFAPESPGVATPGLSGAGGVGNPARYSASGALE